MVVFYECLLVVGIVSQLLLKEDFYLVGICDCLGQSVDFMVVVEMNLFLLCDYSVVWVWVIEVFILCCLLVKIIGEIEFIIILIVVIVSGMGVMVLLEFVVCFLCGVVNGWMVWISMFLMSLLLLLNMLVCGSLLLQVQVVKEILLFLVSCLLLENCELQLVSQGIFF